MLSSLKKAWRKLLGDDSAPQLAAQEVDGVFCLLFGQLHVGTLRHEDGEWKFEYTEAFKERSDLRTLVQFPDKSISYVSGDLWPFFTMRIPSLKQPSILAAIEREHIDQTDAVHMLRRFGRRTIANPYELIEAAR